MPRKNQITVEQMQNMLSRMLEFSQERARTCRHVSRYTKNVLEYDRSLEELDILDNLKKDLVDLNRFYNRE